MQYSFSIEESKNPNSRSDIVTQSAKAANIMNRGITRSIFRWIHIVLAIPLLGLSLFLSLSFRDFGCGKAMLFDDLSRRDLRLAQVRTRVLDLGSADDVAVSDIRSI